MLLSKYTRLPRSRRGNHQPSQLYPPNQSRFPLTWSPILSNVLFLSWQTGSPLRYSHHLIIFAEYGITCINKRLQRFIGCAYLCRIYARVT